MGRHSTEPPYTAGQATTTSRFQLKSSAHPDPGAPTTTTGPPCEAIGPMPVPRHLAPTYIQHPNPSPASAHPTGLCTACHPPTCPAQANSWGQAGCPVTHKQLPLPGGLGGPSWAPTGHSLQSPIQTFPNPLRPASHQCQELDSSQGSSPQCPRAQDSEPHWAP